LPKGVGRGVSVQFAFATYMAQVAEVEVSREGAVRVRRVVCAVDCGTVVNPDTVRAQIQSAIIFGVTAALYGEITLKDGVAITSSKDRALMCSWCWAVNSSIMTTSYLSVDRSMAGEVVSPDNENGAGLGAFCMRKRSTCAVGPEPSAKPVPTTRHGLQDIPVEAKRRFGLPSAKADDMAHPHDLGQVPLL
jgi:Molybdopterin-binding domain of aldehyde dehydrogenase